MQITFDLDKPTAREVAEALKGVRKGKTVAMGELLSYVTVECPKAWGDPGKPETFSDAPMQTVLGPAFAAFKETLESYKADVTGVEFDLEKVTPREFDLIMTSADTNDVAACAALLVSFVKKCPPEWGDPKSTDTYLNLKYYAQFRPLTRKLAEAGSGEIVNFLK